MAITISGQNNNDKILASDGVLDQISGFNIVGVLTASTFECTGEITANHIDVGSTIQLGNAGIITATTLIGNVTGNVNSTSNLLLQISGNEKFRVGNNGQLGIGGANYGSSGQVLTSAGSGSAPTWTTISSDLVSDSSPQLGGALQSNGNRIKMADDDHIKLGSDDDMSFYHNGSSGYLNCTTGDLHLRTSGSGDDVIIKAADDVLIQPQGGEDGIKVIGNGAVELFHNGTKMFETESRGAFVRKADGGETLFTVGSTNAGGVRLALDGDSNGDATGNDYAYLQHNSSGNFIVAADNPSGNSELIFCSGNADARAKFDSSGHFFPVSNDTYDLGTTALRWRNLYVNDLQLSNEAKKDEGGNDVDGTWGDWTLQEGENDIFMINKRNGKKFKINMTEVS